MNILILLTKHGLTGEKRTKLARKIDKKDGNAMSNGKQIDMNRLKDRARHRWLGIFQALAPTLSEAAQKVGKHVPCPVHGGHDGFRLFGQADRGYSDGLGICNTCQAFSKDGRRTALDGFGLLSWANGWSFRESLEAVDNYLSDNSQVLNNIIQSVEKQSAPKTNRNKSGKAKAVYAQMANSRIEPSKTHIAYLKKRGIEGAANIKSESILFSDGIIYKNGFKAPAILGKFTNIQNEVLGLHQIYLTPDGDKLNQLPNGDPCECKRFLRKSDTLKGGAIRFGNAGRVLAVGEGLETMLAVALAFNSRSIAAACTASLLSQVEVPEHVEKLVIYADKDRSGEGGRAANALFEREKRRRVVEIRNPRPKIPVNSKGIDWLDIYNMNGNLLA